jgi:hypothetical protein
VKIVVRVRILATNSNPRSNAADDAINPKIDELVVPGYQPGAGTSDGLNGDVE